MKRAQKVKKLCRVLNGFVEDHKGIIDDKSKADLKALEERVDGVAKSIENAVSEVSVSRSSRDASFARLQKAIIGCKKAVEWVVVRDGKNVSVPHISVLINNPARIHILGEQFLKAAGQAGKDPMLDKAIATLKPALDAYLRSYGEAYDRVTASRSSNEDLEEELASLAGQVNGYKLILMYRAKGDDRNELINLFKATFPREKGNNGEKAKAEQTTTVTAKPTAIPALPTIPGLTTVPQTGDHPQMAANA